MKNRLLYLIFATMLGCTASEAPVESGAGESSGNDDTPSEPAVIPERDSERPVPPPTFMDEPTRLVAMGDVHGDYDATIAALKTAGAIDDDLKWVGGDMVLMQTGDQLDRGHGERAILNLFESLADQA